MVTYKDDEIRQEVLNELNREPKISNPDGLQVTVNNRVVVLRGHVHSFVDQLAAQAVAERVPGVEGVVQDIEVILPADSKREDIEITLSAAHALELNSFIPLGSIKVIVEDGFITLHGEVEWQHQKEEAESTVSKIRGIKGVINNIKVKAKISSIDVMSQIEREFKLMVAVHAKDIHVDIQGSKVILTGMVRAWVEKVEAEKAARETLGVTEVENKLVLSPLLEGKEPVPTNS